MKPAPILLFYFYLIRCAASISLRAYFLTIEQLIRHARGPPTSTNIPLLVQVDFSRTNSPFPVEDGSQIITGSMQTGRGLRERRAKNQIVC